MTLYFFSNTKEDLQSKLDILNDYCEEWCLGINPKKSKVIIFNKSGKLLKYNFHIGTNTIDCTKNYKYLGITMENSGNFTEARKQLFQTAIKASFKLCRDMKSATPSIKTFLHLFDHCIKPIALYGCENWGVINITQKRKELNLYDIFKECESEKINLKFCKYMLRVSKKCINIAVLTELGRFPMYIDILKQMFMYWHRLEHPPPPPPHTPTLKFIKSSI